MVKLHFCTVYLLEEAFLSIQLKPEHAVSLETIQKQSVQISKFVNFTNDYRKRQLHDICYLQAPSKFSQPKIEVKNKELTQWLLRTVWNCLGMYDQKQASEQIKRNLGDEYEAKCIFCRGSNILLHSYSMSQLQIQIDS